MPFLADGISPVPLVAVHGNFASKRWYAPLVASPPAGCAVHALDLPGFGEQAHAGLARPSIAHFADALSDFMRARALERPVLIGHSLGGAVVAELARRDPAAIRGLVLISSAPLDGFKVPLAHFPVLKLYQHNRAVLRKALEVLFACPLPPDFDAVVDDAQGMHPAAFTGNARALGRWSALADLPTLQRIPTLILGGKRDPIIRPAMVRRMGEQLPHATLRMFPHIGHALPLEAPALLRQELERFVAGLSPVL